MKRVIYILAVVLSFGSVASALTLEECVTLALRNNASLRSARNSVQMSEYQRKAAFSNYFPQVNASALGFIADKYLMDMSDMGADLTPVIMTLPPETINAIMSLDMPTGYMKKGALVAVNAVQPIYAGGRIVNGNKLAKAGEEVSRLQLAQTESDVRLNTTRYFWQLVQLQSKLDILDAVDAQLASIAHDAEVAVKAGLTNRNDLLKVQIKQNEIASNRLTLKNATSIVQNLLAQYIGEDSVSITTPDLNAITKQPSELFVNASDAVYATNEYQLLQKNVEVQKLQKKVELGKNLPSLSVGASYSYETLLGKGRNHIIGMATLSIPITDWWGGSNNIKKQTLAIENAQIQLDDNSDLLRVNINNKWNALNESYVQIGLARQTIEQAEENLRIQRDTYNAGMSTMSDLLDAQTILRQANNQLTESQTKYQICIAEYLQAIGR